MTTTSPEPGQSLVEPQHQRMTKANADDIHEVNCDVQRSVRYHKARERFFEWYRNLFTFVTLLSSSGVVVTLLSENRQISLVLGVVVAAIQATDLIWQPGQQARVHNGLASEFVSLERALVRKEIVSAGDLREIKAEMLMIEAREPPVRRYLDIICHNQVAVSLGSPDKSPLSKWQRRLAHWRSGDEALQ